MGKRNIVSVLGYSVKMFYSDVNFQNIRAEFLFTTETAFLPNARSKPFHRTQLQKIRTFALSFTGEKIHFCVGFFSSSSLCTGERQQSMIQVSVKVREKCCCLWTMTWHCITLSKPTSIQRKKNTCFGNFIIITWECVRRELSRLLDAMKIWCRK